ncbi:MAG: hypothetical protein IPP79_09400 [Chitinophagaceae bacterium]|nr:hypothetical protein [Chitinophagaceae bacterium]
MAVLFNAGAQVPVIPFNDVVGRAAKAPPEQMAATGLNVGTSVGFTTIVSVVLLAHCPTAGVNK